MDYPYPEPSLHQVSLGLACNKLFLGSSVVTLCVDLLLIVYRFGDLKLQKPESKAFAQMFQKTYAGKILACHMQLLNAIRSGDYLPDRVINLVLQYLTNRCVLILMIRHFVLV